MNNMNSRKGFTLVEILVAVLILVVLITMAVPMYERAIEKSRVAEVSVALKRLGEAKLRTMDNRNITDFTSTSFTINQLDVAAPAAGQFTYSLLPSRYPNAVCAVKTKGKNVGTTFLYLGETAGEYCTCSSSQESYCGASTPTVCSTYCCSSAKLFCSGGKCEDYGMDNMDVDDVGTCQ